MSSPALGQVGAPALESQPDIEHPLAHEVDIAIVGAGPVGLALAAWLASRSATRALSVALIDADGADPAGGDVAEVAAATVTARAAVPADPRVLALSHGSKVLLESLTTLRWPAGATPIHRIHISQRGHFGRTTIDRDEHALPALGHVLRYRSLSDALRSAVDAIARLPGTRLQRFHRTTATLASDTAETRTADGTSGVTLQLRHAGADSAGAALGILHARLLINAEGGLYKRVAVPPGAAADSVASSADDSASPTAATPLRARDYRQTAIVGTVSVAAPRPNVAWERFTPEGPIALLPIGKSAAGAGDYALVWCCRPESAARRMQLPDAAFLAELTEAFGERMGRFTQIDGRAAFALGLKARRELVKGRTVAIGNAAQTLHPVAGQGLNLGLRDAHSLVDALARYGATPAALAAFARRRQLDRRLTIGFTDLLARGFAVDLAPLATLRGLALTALEFAPPLKSILARHMIFGQRD